MNVRSKSKPLDWKKFLVVALVLGVAGYQWYTQNVKNPPAENRGEVAATVDEAKYNARLPADVKSNSKTQAQPAASSNQEFLVSIGGKNLQSPAGLIYGMGGGGEHRVDHVMNHSVDDPKRPAHGVFVGDRDSILKLIDEAYELVKSKSKYVKKQNSRGNEDYTISMGRKTGYEGGQKGKRSNHKELRSIKLILNGDRVITAYPYR